MAFINSSGSGSVPHFPFLFLLFLSPLSNRAVLVQLSFTHSHSLARRNTLITLPSCFFVQSSTHSLTHAKQWSPSPLSSSLLPFSSSPTLLPSKSASPKSSLTLPHNGRRLAMLLVEVNNVIQSPSRLSPPYLQQQATATNRTPPIT